MSQKDDPYKMGGRLPSSIPESGCGQRNANIERLRLLAAFGIVVFHVMPTDGLEKSIGYAGLPIFLMVFSALILSHKHEMTLRPFLFNKARRLLAPWVFWSGVYFTVKWSKALICNDTGFHIPTNLLIVGPSVHLWYLPYAFTLALVLVLYQKQIVGHENGFVCIGASIAAMVCYPLCAVLVDGTQWRAPLPQWMFGFPGILLGVSIAHINHLCKTRHRLMAFLAVWGMLCIIACLLVNRGIRSLSIPYLVAFPLVALCFVWPGRLDRFTLKISTLTYGIYLVHPLVISLLSRISPTGFLFSLVVFVLSGCIASFLKKTRLSWTV